MRQTQLFLWLVFVINCVIGYCAYCYAQEENKPESTGTINQAETITTSDSRVNTETIVANQTLRLDNNTPVDSDMISLNISSIENMALSGSHQSLSTVPVASDTLIAESQQETKKQTPMGQQSSTISTALPGIKSCFRRYIKPVDINAKDFVSIIGQREDHLLITVGDIVYLTSSHSREVRKDERLYIYKYTKHTFPHIQPEPFEWFEEVGILKILESNEKLSVGRVIAARDIIQKGDVIFLGNQL